MELTALDSFTFVVSGRPRPKERPRLGRRGRVFTPQRTRDYERAWGEAAAASMPTGWDMTCEYRVSMALYFRKGATPDLDNCIKVIDGLNGVAWTDDRQVTEISALKLTHANECAVVTIDRLTEPKALPAKRKPRPKAPKPRADAAAGDALMKVFKMKRAPWRRGRGAT